MNYSNEVYSSWAWEVFKPMLGHSLTKVNVKESSKQPQDLGPKSETHLRVTVTKWTPYFQPYKSNILESNCENKPLILQQTFTWKVNNQNERKGRMCCRAMDQAATLDNQALKSNIFTNSSSVSKRKSQDLCYLMFMKSPPTALPGKLRTEDAKWFLKTA